MQRLRYAEIHFRYPGNYGHSLRNWQQLEKMMGWSVVGRHAHMTNEYPTSSGAMNKKELLVSAFHLSEMIRVASVAVEMVAVYHERDSLARNYQQLDIGSGTISYRPTGKYEDKSLHGLEIRLMLEESQHYSNTIVNNLQAGFREWRTGRLRVPYHSHINNQMGIWLANMKKKGVTASAEYSRIASWYKTFEQYYKRTDLSWTYRKDALTRIEQLVLNKRAHLASNLQLLWLLNNWTEDPYISTLPKFNMESYFRAKSIALQRIARGHDPKEETRKFLKDSGLGDAFLQPFGLNL